MGHSGDSDEIPFVKSSSPPCNDKERLQILKVHTYVGHLTWYVYSHKRESRGEGRHHIILVQ